MYERAEWLEEVMETSQMELWRDKIENLIEFIDDFYDEDLTDYVELALYEFSDYF